MMKWLAASAAVVLTPVAIYALAVIANNNFHEVLPGELYRSAQPSAAELDDYVRRNGIKSVLNLRGDGEGSPWYDEEVAASRQRGLSHANYRLSVKRELTDADVTNLLTILESLPKPILIHCKSGADRTGLVSALYLARISHASEEDAEAQMSIWYGHIGVPYTQAWPMNLTFERLEPWLGYPNS